jgi:23S rRNA pseudouridine955/2504/2580 synthase
MNQDRPEHDCLNQEREGQCRRPVQLWDVEAAEAGQKLLTFLDRRLRGNVPRSALQRWIRTGQVRVDGGRAKAGTRLAAGRHIRVPPHSLSANPGAKVEPGGQQGPETACAWDASSAECAGHQLGLDVVHEDQDMLVVSKPAGLPVHPGTGHTDCVTARLHSRFHDRPWLPTPVHRLDRHTSGILAIAKTYQWLRAMHAQWQSGQVRKLYLAWVQGNPNWSGPCCIQDLAGKTGAPGSQKMVTGAGKDCRSLAWPLVQGREASLMLIALLTGRTHQIRVQMARRGHALIGDVKYGGQPCGQGMLLHAWQLGWPGRTFTVTPGWTGPWSTLIVPPDRLARYSVEMEAMQTSQNLAPSG